MHCLTNNSHKLSLAVIFTLLAFIFIFFTIQVSRGESFNFDSKILQWTHSYESELVTDIAVGCTFFGSQIFLLPANIILGCIFLFINKKRQYAWKIAVVSLSSSGFLFLVKYLVKRPRPDTPMLDAALHYSFPSGHTFTSITFFGMLAYFAARYIKNNYVNRSIIIACVVLVIFIAWSRVYLNVHYASDVIAGFCLGCLWLIMAKWLLFRNETRPH